MSKLINPNDYIKLSSYTHKYGVCNRKLYRHISDDDIDYIIVDGVPFIKDEPSTILKTNNSGRKPSKNVKILTVKDNNVKTLTLSTINPSNLIRKDDLKNVETLTLSKNQNVEILTLKDRLNELLAIPESERTIKDFNEIDEINKKL